MAHVSQEANRLNGPNHHRLTQAGSEEVFQIRNFDLPRERRNIHFAHFAYLGTSPHRGGSPESRAAAATIRDYSSFGRVVLRLLSGLLEIADRTGVSSPRAVHDESPHSMGRKRSSALAARIAQTDYRCLSVDGSQARGELARTSQGATRHQPQVVDDLPTVVPVTEHELAVLETYLGSLLDDMLKKITH
jgi:hypothetical protein